MTYSLLANYLSLREILIKCYKHSQKQLKAPPGEWQCQTQTYSTTDAVPTILTILNGC